MKVQIQKGKSLYWQFYNLEEITIPALADTQKIDCLGRETHFCVIPSSKIFSLVVCLSMQINSLVLLKFIVFGR